MKKTYWLAFVAVFFYSSCNKAFQSTTPGSLSYSISYVNRYITAGGTLHLNPNLQINNGTVSKIPITISFSGLPNNVSVNPSSITINSNYSPTFLVTANTNANPGTYNLQMLVSSDGADPQTFNFKLVVLPAYNCAANIFPAYSYHTYACQGVYYGVTLDTIAGVTNQFTISNFGNWGTSSKLLVLIDCNTGSSSYTNIFIPQQQINGNTVSGTGTYYNSSNHISLSIYDTVTNSSNVKTNCNFSIN